MNAKNIPKLAIVRFMAGVVGLGATLTLGGCYVEPVAVEPAPAVVVGPDVVEPPPVIFVGPRYYRR
jgi:hypothetical protein